MNYRDDLLENKTFNFFKEFLYNLALSVCIILVGVLIAVYGFKFKLYEVLSGSETPYFYEGDIIVVKQQNEYKVGDIIKFMESVNDKPGLPTAHRLIAIYEYGGETYYICHGDNVQSAKTLPQQEVEPGVKKYYDKDTKTYYDDQIVPWEVDSAYVKSLMDQHLSISQIKSKARNLQTPTLSQVEGKVVSNVRHYGEYIKFVKGHYMLLITLVAAVWSISACIQNELYIKRSMRLA